MGTNGYNLLWQGFDWPPSLKTIHTGLNNPSIYCTLKIDEGISSSDPDRLDAGYMIKEKIGNINHLSVQINPHRYPQKAFTIDLQGLNNCVSIFIICKYPENIKVVLPKKLDDLKYFSYVGGGLYQEMLDTVAGSPHLEELYIRVGEPQSPNLSSPIVDIPEPKNKNNIRIWYIMAPHRNTTVSDWDAPKLEYLKLSGHNMFKIPIKLIANPRSVLKYIDFSDNQLDLNAVYPIIDSLKNSSSQAVVLSRNPIVEPPMWCFDNFFNPHNISYAISRGILRYCANHTYARFIADRSRRDTLSRGELLQYVSIDNDGYRSKLDYLLEYIDRISNQKVVILRDINFISENFSKLSGIDLDKIENEWSRNRHSSYDTILYRPFKK